MCAPGSCPSRAGKTRGLGKGGFGESHHASRAGSTSCFAGVGVGISVACWCPSGLCIRKRSASFTSERAAAAADATRFDSSGEWLDASTGDDNTSVTRDMTFAVAVSDPLRTELAPSSTRLPRNSGGLCAGARGKPLSAVSAGSSKAAGRTRIEPLRSLSVTASAGGAFGPAEAHRPRSDGSELTFSRG